MLKRITVFVLGGVLCIAPVAAGQGDDPGLPDTLHFGNATVSVGVSSPMLIRVCNDYAIDAFALAVEIASVDSGSVHFDSVRYVGRMADPSILQQRIVNTRRLDGNMPDSLLLAMLKLVSNPLPAGSDALLAVYFTGVHAGHVSVDSVYFNGTVVDFVTPSSVEYTPVVVPGLIEVVSSALPPVITLSAGSPIVTIVGEQADFSIDVQSPPGFPTDLELSSMAAWDDPTSLPQGTPDLDGSGEFSWTPGAGDVGVWRASFLATDSSGAIATMDVQIQVVSTDDYLLDFEAVGNEGANVTINLEHGDFDNNGVWELLVSGLSTTTSVAFSEFVHVGGGSLDNVLNWGPKSLDYNLAVGMVDGDDYLDGVLIHDGLLRVIRGGASGITTIDAITNRPGSLRDGALIDFNGDAHLDYVCASLSGCAVYLGGENATFVERTWFVQGYSVLSINAADFNDDGYNDLALGTTEGLQVLIGDGQGNFVEGESYEQEFGSVDIEVTTRGADFNGDLRYDICLASPSQGGQYSDLYVYLGNADGSFEPVQVRRVLGQIFAARPGDFNGDAVLDIAYLNGSERYVAIAYGDGAGGFADELRFAVPKYSPRRLDCLDIDFDGDLDLVVASYFQGFTTNSSLYVYLNQSNPGRVSREYLEVRAANNVDIELRAPSGARLNRVCNTIASGELYMCDADQNERLDVKAACRTIEPGRYDLIATPRKNAPGGAPFSLEYSVGDQRFALVGDMPSNGQYVFPIYPDISSPVTPVQGATAQGALPHFTWPDGGETRFELARDLNFTQIIQSTSVSGGSHTLSSALPETDSTPYFWRVRSDGPAGENVVYVFSAVASPTGIDTDDNDGMLPTDYALEQNYPNPFNPQTSISYAVPGPAHVKVTVHNVLGQQVAVLVDHVKAAGVYSVTWDATDSEGRQVASGIYFYRLQTEEWSATKKMVLLR